MLQSGRRRSRDYFRRFTKEKEDGAYPLNRGNKSDNPDIPTKSLIGIPERFVLEMLKRGWCRRNTVIWHKRNVMPSSVRDRLTEDFEYLYFFSLSPRYFFEQQFENMATPENKQANSDWHNKPYRGNDLPGQYIQEGEGGSKRANPNKPAGYPALGRNKRTVWTINTASGGRGVHYATFPPALCATPILASVPEYICSKCGKPRVRIYKKGETSHEAETEASYPHGSNSKRLALLRQAARARGEEYQNTMEFIGLSNCGCGAPWVPGTVLDPFGGTGTVAFEARRLGRKAICIDISEEYSKLAVEKVTAIPNPFE